MRRPICDNKRDPEDGSFGIGTFGSIVWRLLLGSYCKPCERLRMLVPAWEDAIIARDVTVHRIAFDKCVRCRQRLKACASS